MPAKRYSGALLQHARGLGYDMLILNAVEAEWTGRNFIGNKIVLYEGLRGLRQNFYEPELSFKPETDNCASPLPDSTLTTFSMQSKASVFL